MNLQDRIVKIISEYHDEPYDLSVEDAAKAILALVEEDKARAYSDGYNACSKLCEKFAAPPTVSEQKKSKCCGQPAVLTNSGESFCGGWKGCGKWCEVVEDSQVEPSTNLFQYRVQDTPALDSDFVEPTAPVAWEREFDKTWVEKWETGTTMDGDYTDVDREAIKDFIRQTIKNREREIVEGVNKMKDEILANAEGKMDDETRAMRMVAVIKNSVCDSVLALINKQ